jgi:hypothetical protein
MARQRQVMWAEAPVRLPQSSVERLQRTLSPREPRLQPGHTALAGEHPQLREAQAVEKAFQLSEAGPNAWDRRSGSRLAG